MDDFCPEDRKSARQNAEDLIGDPQPKVKYCARDVIDLLDRLEEVERERDQYRKKWESHTSHKSFPW